MKHPENSHLRRTKVLATLGPATDAEGVLDDLVRAGVNVVRLNFSHGAPEQHARRVAAVREAAQRQGREVGILADLQGPKIRLGTFAGGPVQWNTGDIVRITVEDVAGTHDRVSTTYEGLARDAKAGDRQLVDDGKTLLTPFLPRSSQRVFEMLGGRGSWADMPRIDDVDEDGGRPDPVITGDYGGAAAWASAPIRPGTALQAPTPLFAKIDVNGDDVRVAERVRREVESRGIEVAGRRGGVAVGGRDLPLVDKSTPPGPVTALVRPEAVTLASRDAEGSGPLVGTVIAVTFLGATSRVTVDLGDTTILAQLPTSDATALSAGSRVSLMIRPDPVLVSGAEPAVSQE